MTISFKDILENKRYGYCRVSSKEQARNSSLDTQKSELIRAGVPEQNILTEVGSATESIKKRPVFYHLINDELYPIQSISQTRSQINYTLKLKPLSNRLPETRSTTFTASETPLKRTN